MFPFSEYTTRGYNLFHNRLRPQRKRLSSLMLYATDLCDSGCKHCLIWAKRPVTMLSLETIKRIMSSECVHVSTVVGLEGGEFLLHPEAEEIMDWFSKHHRNYDLFSNCLRPDRLIEAVRKYKPRRLYISLDGDKTTYQYMRGKDGYDRVLDVIRELKSEVPVFVMFTLSPYNDFEDLKHVAAVCRENKVFLRVGIYDNIAFFDTIDDAARSFFGEHKNEKVLTYSEVKELRERVGEGEVVDDRKSADGRGNVEGIPEEIKEFSENYDYVKLYGKWRGGEVRLKCNSILDSLIVLPDGKVPICQHLSTSLGNIHDTGLDELFNSAESGALQQHHVEHCNQCWVSYHRKYDIILYRTLEKYFGRWATSKMLGYYKWDEDDSLSYRQVMARD